MIPAYERLRRARLGLYRQRPGRAPIMGKLAMYKSRTGAGVSLSLVILAVLTAIVTLFAASMLVALGHLLEGAAVAWIGTVNVVFVAAVWAGIELLREISAGQARGH